MPETVPAADASRSERVEEEQAAAAGLVYVSDSDPGIWRSAKGKGFAFRGPDGKPLSPSQLRRVRSLAIPPAWMDVWICPETNGHIQATGRDARGRKQYIYHPQWRALRDDHKFAHMLDFARLLPRIRRRISADMALHGTPREKVLATVVALLDRTLIRVGNAEYARANGSFGLTTLRERHIEVEGSELRFEFKGKSGKVWRLPFRDRRIARIVRTLQELPGQHLFKYTSDDGIVTAVGSADVNAYLQEITGADVSAKDFRTWAGTVLAATSLGALGPHENATQAKKGLKQAIAAVAERLGNTITICRKSYIHPEVMTCYLDGSFPALGLSQEMPALGTTDGLSSEEKAVLNFLEQRLAEKPPAGLEATEAPMPLAAALAASTMPQPKPKRTSSKRNGLR